MDLFHPRCQCFAWGRCAWCSARGQEGHQANCQGDGSTGAVLRCRKSHFFTKLQLWRKFFEMILDEQWTSYVGKVRSQFIMIFGVGQKIYGDPWEHRHLCRVSSLAGAPHHGNGWRWWSLWSQLHGHSRGGGERTRWRQRLRLHQGLHCK